MYYLHPGIYTSGQSRLFHQLEADAPASVASRDTFFFFHLDHWDANICEKGLCAYAMVRECRREESVGLDVGRVKVDGRLGGGRRWTVFICRFVFLVWQLFVVFWFCFLLCPQAKSMQSNAKQIKANQSKAKANQSKSNAKQCKAMQSKVMQIKVMQSNANKAK